MNRKDRTQWLLTAFALCTALPVKADLTTAGLKSGKGDQIIQMAENIHTAYNYFQQTAAKKQADYDKAQDITPKQMHILLEVCERTGGNLGQMLAVGETESAHTWNDYVRPPVNGGLGAASGIWQFMPGTFSNTLRMYGNNILAQSQGMNLGNDHFTDKQVRTLISNAARGKTAGEETLIEALRGNTAVLGFAKYWLDIDSGETSGSGKDLNHFLGAKTLNLLRNADPNMPVVKLPQAAPTTEVSANAVAAPPEAAPTTETSAEAAPPVSNGLLEATDPTVMGNKYMFYQDGSRATKPFTVKQFFANAERIYGSNTHDQFVRAKYGVGFPINGGDVSGRSIHQLSSKQLRDGLPKGEQGNFTAANGEPLRIPSPLIYGTLTKEEMGHYKERLKELDKAGHNQPTDSLPHEETKHVMDMLKRQNVLAYDTAATQLSDPQVKQALRSFMEKSGMNYKRDKDENGIPYHDGKLLPSTRVALELYDTRIQTYAAKQLEQKTSLAQGKGVDLHKLNSLPEDKKKELAPEIIALKQSLAHEGVLSQPIVKEKKVNSRGKLYMARTPQPFDATLDAPTLKKMITALDDLQLRNGLKVTQGVLDTATLALLQRPPMDHAPFMAASPATSFNANSALPIPIPQQEMITMPPALRQWGEPKFDPVKEEAKPIKQPPRHKPSGGHHHK